MLRSLRFRPVAALLALVYLALPGGAAGVRSCAHHDASAADEAEVAGHHSAGHADPAPQNSHSEPDHTSPADDGEPEPHGGCSCLDACAAASADVIPGYSPTRTAASVVEAAAVTIVIAQAPHAARPDHFLPYPNAPPVIPS